MNFFRDETAQDITEYSLLLAFVTCAAAGIFVINGQSLTGIWTIANGIANQGISQAHGS